MGVEMDEQAGKIEALQQRAEDAGLGLRGVAKSAAKLVGRAPAERRGASSAGGWQAGQDAASAAVARATLASAPAALRYSSKALR